MKYSNLNKQIGIKWVSINYRGITRAGPGEPNGGAKI